MSAELNNYLKTLPIYQFKLVDGSSIIGKLVDIEDDIVHLEETHEVRYHENSKHQVELTMHKWMYLSDEKTTQVNLNHVISYSELNTTSKQFYSKSVLKAKIEALKDDLMEDGNKSLFSDVFNSIIEGLDNQDSGSDNSSISDWDFGDYNNDRWNID